MSLSRILSVLLASALLGPAAAAQCPARWQQFDGTGLLYPQYGLFAGEEYGLRVDGIPLAHFPIEIIAIGVGWVGAPTSGGSVHVYATGYPTLDEVPLYSAPSPTVTAGLNRIDLGSSGPFVMASQPFVCTWRYGTQVVGELAVDGNGAQPGNYIHYLFYPGGPAWLEVPPGPSFHDYVLWIEYVPASVGTTFCLGDGSQGDCPCGPAQNGGVGAGCINSTGRGADLKAFGEASVSMDSLQLTARALPPTTTLLLFQYDQEAAPAPYGDGLLCAGGPLVRLQVAVVSGGSTCIGASQTTPLSILGGIPPGGGIVHYQGWYRDAESFCTPAFFNTTGGLTVSWAP